MQFEIREVEELVELMEFGTIQSAEAVCTIDGKLYLDGIAWNSTETLGFERYATQEELDIINDMFVNL